MDVMAFFFYDCKLKKDVGEFRTGETVKSVLIDYAKGTMEFWTNPESGVCDTTFKLTMRAEKIK